MKLLRHYITHIFILFLAVASGLSAQNEKETVTAVPANDFLKTIGVNTSINHRGEYINKTLEVIQYIGARYIRAGGPDANTRLVHYRWLYELADVRFSCILNTDGDIQATLDGAKEILTLGEDALVGLEGCNEPNNWGIMYQGEIGGGSYNGSAGNHSWKPLARYHRDFYKAVKEDPVLKNYPVWTASDVGAAWENVGMHFLTIPEGAEGVDPEFPAGTTYADVACIHNYFAGITPRTNNQTWLAASPTGTWGNTLKSNFGETWNKKYKGYSDEELETLRRVTTETGTTIDNYNVTEEYQALTYLSCYLAQFVRGFEYTAMYILRDRSDEGGNQTFGFYKTDYTPRRSAHYLHNMTTILKDRVSIENPGTLTYSLSNRPETLHELLLQKNDGTMMLVIWGEKFARNAVADEVTVEFDQAFEKINVYNPAQYTDADPEIGTRPVATYENVSSIDLAVLNHPFIIEIDPKPTGLNDVKESQAIVFPTLVEDMLYVRGQDEISKVEVVDLTGKTAYTSGENTNVLEIDLSGLPGGSYLLKLTMANRKTEVHKIIKL
ncbi:MAG: T9SS type A sorting domain-containing protein [Candidatus Azobacteroides sp.]|nr:T9SS type A sorting domain-containing protein [Candidatus Azobacteroides sp.]